MTNRRTFLAGLAGLAGSAFPRATWADAGGPAYLAAAKAGEAYFLHGLSEAGESLFALQLPSRGHAAAAHPTRPLAVAFARRPGTFAVVIDCATGVESARLIPPDGRQFNGHGVFSADGSILYTSEVVAETSQGRIGLWDATRFVRIGEWASGGIGPHDIKRLGDTLVIANGGIQTDPTDRTKLNLGSMRPNLTQLSVAGQVLAQADLPDLPQNSIRHLAVGQGGQVAFAMQWEGDPAEDVPLLGLWRPGGTALLCPAADAENPRLKGYLGSIACNAAGQFALTAPKGGVAMVFDPQGTHLTTVVRPDICGVAPMGQDSFIFTDGNGVLSLLQEGQMRPLVQTAMQWDNHLVRL